MKESGKKIQESGDTVKDNEVLFQFVTFKLGGEDYAVGIQFVKEVTITPRISRIPKTPAFILGVANIRGDLIAIIDLEERFGMKPLLHVKNDTASDLDFHSYTMVIDAGDYSVGFVVKEMPDTLTLTESQIENSSNVIEKAKFKNKFISGLGKKGDGNVIVLLDILKVLSKKEINQVTSIQGSESK